MCIPTQFILLMLHHVYSDSLYLLTVTLLFSSLQAYNAYLPHNIFRSVFLPNNLPDIVKEEMEGRNFAQAAVFHPAVFNLQLLRVVLH